MGIQAYNFLVGLVVDSDNLLLQQTPVYICHFTGSSLGGGVFRKLLEKIENFKFVKKKSPVPPE